MDEWNGGRRSPHIINDAHGIFNRVLLQLSLLRYDDSGELDQTSIIPLIDGGTEGEGEKCE